MGWALPSRGRRPGAGGAAAVHPEERPPRLPRESDSLRERARDKLDAAREQGRAFRRLVQLPALRAAAACIFAGTAVPITYTIVSVATGAHDARHLTMVKVGYCVVIPAVIVVLFVLMPTDVRLNRRAAALLSLASALGGLLELYITEEYVRSLVLRRECVLVETGTPTTCEHAIVDAALQGSVGCVLLMLTLSLCMLLLRSSHASELLLRTCRNVGYTLSYVGVCDFARNALAAGLGLWTPSAHFLVLIALGSEMVAVGGALLVPSVRARVHGWLASRGEAVGTAVGIAALIDGNDADDVNRLAATLFRAVPANLLEFSDFASNERADPSLMLRKSTPAHFGEVDAFLSHSCAPGAPRACAWRARAARVPAPRLVVVRAAHHYRAPAAQVARRRGDKVGGAASVARGLRRKAPPRAAHLDRPALPAAEPARGGARLPARVPRRLQLAACVGGEDVPETAVVLRRALRLL